MKIKIATEKEQDKENVVETEVADCGGAARFKRGLPTTISPERTNPQRQKSAERGDTDKPRKSAKMSLSFKDLSQSVQDRTNSALSINELVGKPSTQIKVVVVNPNESVETKSKFSDESKSLILNIVRNKWSTVANTVFKHPDVKPNLLLPLRRVIEEEFNSYCKTSSNSLLLAKSPKEVAEFSNKSLMQEIQSSCPFWTSAIQGAIGIENFDSSDKETKINAAALSSAVAARARNHKMSALAYRMSTIIFHSGAKSNDIDRMNKLGVCMSADSTVEFQRKMGENCKSKVLSWKHEIEREKKSILYLEELLEKEINGEIDLSPVSDSAKNCRCYDVDIFEYCKDLVLCIAKGGIITPQVVAAAINRLKATPLPEYKIVGDNIDLMVYARVQTAENPNRSLHWTQQFGVVNRVIEPQLEETYPRKPMKHIELLDLLPVKAVQDNLVNRWAVHVSRIVTKYLECFKSLKDVVVYHIPHEYSKVMAGKSESCSFGVEFLAPNKAGDMAQLLIKNQDNYVPVVKVTDEEPPYIAATVSLHGDQLFEERARNTQWTYQLGGSKFDRLEGIETEFADWHAKYNLYMLEYATFVRDASSKEHGTTRASINRTSKTNAAKGVERHYNEYKEFHKCEVEGHILAAFMEMHGMGKMEDTPSCTVPDKSIPRDKRRKWLLDVCLAFVKEYAVEQEELQPLVEQLEELKQCGDGRFPCRIMDCDKTYVLHSARVKHEVVVHRHVHNQYSRDERDPFGYYYCRAACGLVYSTTAIRNRHETTTHPNFTISQGPGENRPTASEDHTYNYHRSKLVFGLILFEFDDAIKEGDGDRLHDFYRFALLLYKANGKTKYSYVILLYLIKLAGMLSEKAAHNLKWNRFFNKYGLKGGNIPLDLRMEHLNKVVKTMWKSLGSNINEVSAERIANTVEPVELIIDSIDKECDRTSSYGFRAQGNPEAAVAQVTADLMQLRAFQYQSGRLGHPSFLNFPSNLLKKLDYRDLHSWITDLMNKWETVYGLRNQ